MTGGLLNLVSYGSENIILNGNPTRTFWISRYAKYTNFGIQKLRVDYKGERRLRFNEESEMDFTIPRYAELLWNTFVVINLPDIWSPLYYDDVSGEYIPYEFKWIDDLGAMMIKEVSVYGGGSELFKCSGEYIYQQKERDYPFGKRNIWNRMVGNIAELNDPANSNGKVNIYPNAFYVDTTNIEPSIRGRQLLIPIPAWFSQTSKMAFPLISTQYHELHIKITFRPIREMYRIRDITDASYNYPYVSPNPNEDLHSLYRFIQPPQDASSNTYTNKRLDWNADIHLLADYVFLSMDERREFAKHDQKYLIKQVFEYDYFNATGTQSVDVESRNLVISYMMRWRRSDAFMRNEWTNYTNYPYNYIPYQVVPSPVDPNIYITGNFHPENVRDILVDLAILLDGKFRENLLPASVYQYVDKYNKTLGYAKDGLYCYNFCIMCDPQDTQPNGAMNLSKYKNITFEYNTINPPANPNAKPDIICDTDGNVIGVRKQIWRQNAYNFDLHITEERYNILEITSGMMGLAFAN